MFWSRFPFVRIIIPFILGIVTAVYFNLTQPLPFFVFLIIYLLGSLHLLILRKKLSHRFRWMNGLVIIVLFVITGYQIKVLSDPAYYSSYFGHHLSKKSTFYCTLAEPVRATEKTYKAIVKINEIKDSTSWHLTSGKAILYLEKDSLAKQLSYGDLILVTGSLSGIGPPMNPGEFDYKTYLKNQYIEYRAYISKNHWKFMAGGYGNTIKNYAYRFREKLLSIIDNSGLQGKESGVISALLVGYRDKLDPELIKEYRASGAVHILCVSGLHVGVIYMVLSFFLFFLDRFRYGRIVKAIILILFIWFYALLTGLSPSVLRAATMFGFIALGNALKYKANIYNTLAASAFILLLANPNILFDVGFQLSYLAVIGIVSIYPIMYKRWSSRYWLVNKIWSLVVVSIAAQIVTFPLVLFYFHQFPNYFILSNMIAVPLSALIIYFGIAYLIFYSVPFVSFLLSKGLMISLVSLNKSISFIESLPYSVSRNISTSAAEMVIIYGIIILFFMFLVRKKQKWLISTLALFLIFLGCVSVKSFKKLHQKLIIVYNISKHTAIDFVDGPACYFVTDSVLANDHKKQEFAITNSRIKNSTQTLKTFILGNNSKMITGNSFYKNHELIYFAGKTMAVYNKKLTNPKQIKVDYLLLTNNPAVSLNIILSQYTPGLIIIDASNSMRNTERLAGECKKYGIPYYITAKSGAWIYQVNT